VRAEAVQQAVAVEHDLVVLHAPRAAVVVEQGDHLLELVQGLALQVPVAGQGRLLLRPRLDRALDHAVLLLIAQVERADGDGHVGQQPLVLLAVLLHHALRLLQDQPAFHHAAIARQPVGDEEVGQPHLIQLLHVGAVLRHPLSQDDLDAALDLAVHAARLGRGVDVRHIAGRMVGRVERGAHPFAGAADLGQRGGLLRFAIGRQAGQDGGRGGQHQARGERGAHAMQRRAKAFEQRQDQDHQGGGQQQRDGGADRAADAVAHRFGRIGDAGRAVGLEHQRQQPQTDVQDPGPRPQGAAGSRGFGRCRCRERHRRAGAFRVQGGFSTRFHGGRQPRNI